MNDNTKSYSEVCNAIRHYSGLSYNVRTLSVVQGLILVAAWFLNYKEDVFLPLFLIPIFGIVFTILIYMFHIGYYDSTSHFIEIASEMEKTLFDDGFRPFGKFKEYHQNEYKSDMAKAFVLNAPFTLIGNLFVLLFIITLFIFLK